MTLVRNPFARSSTGGLIDIDRWTRGAPVTCPACSGPMVGRKGSLKIHHFSHAAGTSACSGETLLHIVAKELIRDGFLAAKAAGTPYELRWACPECSETRVTDATKLAATVDLETAPVDGVRSDVVFRGGRRDFAVEVVVTHAVEAETAERYAAARFPVFVVLPSWSEVRGLAAGLFASAASNLGTERCPTCREAAESRARIAQQVGRLRDVLERPSASPAPVLPWDVDKFGHALYRPKASALVLMGERLVSFGFRQCKNPWLFRLTLPDQLGAMFANMGGTEEVPIWRDSRPLLHGQLKCDEELEFALVHEVLRFCASRGVRLRVSHYARLRGIDDDVSRVDT